MASILGLMLTPLNVHLTKTATLAGAVSVLALGTAAGSAAIATSGAGAAPAPHTVTVSSIHERFGHQTCPANAQTQTDLDACAADRVLSLDQKIDRLDTAIVGKLPTAGQKTFVTATRQWLTYRNTVAQAAASPSAGGSIQPLILADSLATEDQAHITALTTEFTSEAGQKP